MEFLETNCKDFDALAHSVIVGVPGAADETALLESLTKVAKNASLKPKEVERLVEGVNLNLTLNHLKEASDKRASFPILSKAAALSKTHGLNDGATDTAETHAKTASAEVEQSFRFTDEDFIRAAAPKGVSLFDIFSIEKQAAHTPEALDRSILFRLDHKAQSARQDVTASIEKIASLYDDLLSRFSQYRSPDFGEFGVKIASLYGEEGETMFRLLAKDLKLDSVVSGSQVKSASIIDDTQPEMQTARALLLSLSKHAEIVRTHQSAQKELEDYRRELWNGFQKSY